MYQSNYNGIYTPQTNVPQAPIAQAPIAQNQVQQSFARPPIQPILKGKPVTSIDEVRATSVDFDGSISYFPDLANGRIYTKQINMDGTSKILMYEPVEIPQPIMKGQDDFITRDEFNAAIQSIQSHFAEVQSTPMNKPVEQSAETSKTAPTNSFNF